MFSDGWKCVWKINAGLDWNSNQILTKSRRRSKGRNSGCMQKNCQQVCQGSHCFEYNNYGRLDYANLGWICTLGRNLWIMLGSLKRYWSIGGIVSMCVGIGSSFCHCYCLKLGYKKWYLDKEQWCVWKDENHQENIFWQDWYTFYKNQ